MKAIVGRASVPFEWDVDQFIPVVPVRYNFIRRDRLSNYIGVRTAIFGGTFDPIHNAHLTVAKEALANFSLDQVLLIPAGNPPHKTGAFHASFEHRFRMVELACAEIPGLEPSRIEQASHRSFSILTIERLKQARPDDELFFLIGADAFSEIRTWYRWQDVIREVEFLVATRPGHDYDIPEGTRVRRLDTVALPVSSSAIRGELAAGRVPEALPKPVFEYIRRHGLYGSAAGALVS